MKRSTFWKGFLAACLLIFCGCSSPIDSKSQPMKAVIDAQSPALVRVNIPHEEYRRIADHLDGLNVTSVQGTTTFTDSSVVISGTDDAGRGYLIELMRGRT